ncbi:sulfotransferase family protein [Flavilitoribacter nigricans]|uniref:Sulfotransferase n=1 Tax=Flavilitoribacter nigricans (strain ATCC 23147 / DSM 23189 / NBRC 102662 / NCIMB 1420 / SS-2) TaxID=1122177 RepID=A0A2D0NJH9_FLAN2|nr:sulfotransferase [Flavilitoribacter nigricans]PHN08588.1 hypothetical protein CRP01_01365 [Flavilitoribacter nigricans DSM 23189 = NBRC 102662]
MNTFFIAGLQRSGTTLLSVMLSKHPEICMEERAVAFRLITTLRNSYDLLPHNLEIDPEDFYRWLIETDKKQRLRTLLDHEKFSQYGSIREMIRRSIAQKLESNGKRVWGDKTPNLHMYLPEALSFFPDARFIHLVRDGRANAFSLARRSYQNLQLSAQQWVDGNMAGLVNRDLLGPERYLLIKYEELLLEPEATLQQVCHFLGLPFHEAVLDLSNKAIPDQEKYVKKTLDRSKIRAYLDHLDALQLQKVERIQGPLLQRLGYELHTKGILEQYRPLSLARRIALNQMDNLRRLFRSRQEGMVNKRYVKIRTPFLNRAYDFLRILTQDLLSRQIFKALFSRVFYTEKHYSKSKPTGTPDREVKRH